MRRFPDPSPPAPDHATPARYLLWLVRRHRATIVLAAFFGILCTVAQGLIPAAIGRAIDAVLIGRDRGALLAWGGAVLGLGVTQAVTGMLRDRSSAANRFGAAYLTMQFVTRQTVRLGDGLARRVSAGEVVAIGAADVNRLGTALETTARGGGAVVSILLVAGIMLTESWRLGTLVLAGVPVMAWLLARLMPLLHGRQQRLRDEQASLTGLAVDIVDGLRVLRGVGGESVFAGRYAERSQRVRRLLVRVAVVQAWVAGVKVLLPGLLITAIVWLGALLVAFGEISGGLLVSFYGFAVFLAEQLRRVTTMVDHLTQAYVAAGRVAGFLSLEPEATRAAEPARPAGAAELTDPEPGITVPADGYLGVVCASPAQADELAGRLAGYTGSGAAVRYGGVPLTAFPREELRRRILLVTAGSRLFSGTLRADLDPYGRGSQDDAVVWQAIDDACARDVVDALPDGLDTVVAGGGREFSGGQRQRLRLARALAAGPEVLILVEPTNALDAHTEGRIARRLKAHRAGRATVVFTTSPILLGHADQVLLVDGGGVAATGTHTGLLADPRYRSVVTREVAAI